MLRAIELRVCMLAHPKAAMSENPARAPELQFCERLPHTLGVANVDYVYLSSERKWRPDCRNNYFKINNVWCCCEALRGTALGGYSFFSQPCFGQTAAKEETGNRDSYPARAFAAQYGPPPVRAGLQRAILTRAGPNFWPAITRTRSRVLKEAGAVPCSAGKTVPKRKRTWTMPTFGSASAPS